MEKKDYLGKWILRQGDLLPEMINDSLWRHYCFTNSFCEHLMDIGLIFDNKELAISHYKCIMGSMKKPVDSKGLREIKYDIKKDPDYWKDKYLNLRKKILQAIDILTFFE